MSVTGVRGTGSVGSTAPTVSNAAAGASSTVAHLAAIQSAAAALNAAAVYVATKVCSESRSLNRRKLALNAGIGKILDLLNDTDEVEQLLAEMKCTAEDALKGPSNKGARHDISGTLAKIERKLHDLICERNETKRLVVVAQRVAGECGSDSPAPVLSAGAERLLFYDPKRGLVLVDTNSSKETVIVPRKNEQISSLSASADLGTFVYFQRDALYAHLHGKKKSRQLLKFPKNTRFLGSAVSADGTALVFSYANLQNNSDSDQLTRRSIVAIMMLQKDRVTIIDSGLFGQVNSLSISPDGGKIAVLAALTGGPYKLYGAEIAERSPVRELAEFTPAVGLAGISNSGQIYLAQQVESEDGSEGAALSVISLAEGKQSSIAELDGIVVRRALMRGDDSNILILAADEESPKRLQLCRFNAHNRKIDRLWQTGMLISDPTNSDISADGSGVAAVLRNGRLKFVSLDWEQDEHLLDIAGPDGQPLSLKVDSLHQALRCLGSHIFSSESLANYAISQIDTNIRRVHGSGQKFKEGLNLFRARFEEIGDERRKPLDKLPREDLEAVDAFTAGLASAIRTMAQQAYVAQANLDPGIAFALLENDTDSSKY